MNKKVKIIGIIIIILILLSVILVCVNNKTRYEKRALFMNGMHNTESEITNLKYEFGSYNGGYYKYEISKEDDIWILKATGSNGIKLNVKKEIDINDINNIQNIILKYNVIDWNGFNKSDKNVLDGYGFSLLINYSNEMKITVKGYMKYPKNYSDFEKEIHEYITEIIK